MYEDMRERLVIYQEIDRYSYINFHPCPNLKTQFSRKQAQNARFQWLKTSVLGSFLQKLCLHYTVISGTDLFQIS